MRAEDEEERSGGDGRVEKEEGGEVREVVRVFRVVLVEKGAERGRGRVPGEGGGDGVGGLEGASVRELCWEENFVYSLGLGIAGEDVPHRGVDDLERRRVEACHCSLQIPHSTSRSKVVEFVDPRLVERAERRGADLEVDVVLLREDLRSELAETEDAKFIQSVPSAELVRFARDEVSRGVRKVVGS